MRKEIAVLVADFDLQHCKHVPVILLGRNRRRLLSILLALVGHCKVGPIAFHKHTNIVLIIACPLEPLNGKYMICCIWIKSKLTVHLTGSLVL